MPPRHVGGIGRKAPAAISRIRAQKIHSRHLSAKTVIENVANRALRKARRRVDAERGIALSRRRRVGEQAADRATGLR